jgi:hypothetical protein
VTHAVVEDRRGLKLSTAAVAGELRLWRQMYAISRSPKRCEASYSGSADSVEKNAKSVRARLGLSCEVPVRVLTRRGSV